ncbi:MAG: exodeoxyribonuclease VII small subunit [Ponticaulis sp.]|nr:exodeoxyribonuclease VII small subunit [Ponticaulis sp.]
MSEKLPVGELSFEDALKELETIVEKLEGGEVPLEESIQIYERGAELKAHCQKKLKTAQLKVEQIVLNQDGEARAEPSDVQA